MGPAHLRLGTSVSLISQQLPMGTGALCFSCIMSIHGGGIPETDFSFNWRVLLPGFSLRAKPTVSFSEDCRLTQRSSHLPLPRAFSPCCPCFGIFWGSVRKIAFLEVLCWCAGALELIDFTVSLSLRLLPFQHPLNDSGAQPFLVFLWLFWSYSVFISLSELWTYVCVYIWIMKMWVYLPPLFCHSGGV